MQAASSCAILLALSEENYYSYENADILLVVLHTSFVLRVSYVLGCHRICADEGCSLVLYDAVYIGTCTTGSATFPDSVFRRLPGKRRLSVRKKQQQSATRQ